MPQRLVAQFEAPMLKFYYPPGVNLPGNPGDAGESSILLSPRDFLASARQVKRTSLINSGEGSFFFR